MPSFSFRASRSDGRIIEGERTAQSSYRLQQELNREGLYPIRIDSKSGEQAQAVEDVFSEWLPIPRKAMADLYDEIATLLEAGLPIVETLRIIQPQVTPRKLATAVADILSDVEEGISLHKAMSARSDLFDETSIRMIEAGEYSGSLAQAFRRIVEMIEFDLEIQGRIKAATRYPKLVFSTLILGLLVVVLVVIPRFVTLFNTANVELPMITQVLLMAQGVLSVGWPIVLALAMLGFVTYSLFSAHPAGRRMLQDTINRIPMLGPLRLKIEMSRVFHILGMMLQCGVDILTAIRLSSHVTGHLRLSEALERFYKRLEQGDSISDSIESDPFFPPLVQRMVTIGDKSGRLSETAIRLSGIYEKQSQTAIKRTSEWIEPVLIALIAVCVLFFALAIFLPMWDLVQAVKR